MTLELGYMTEGHFDSVVRPELMVKPSPYKKKDVDSNNSLGIDSKKVVDNNSYQSSEMKNVPNLDLKQPTRP
jgi:hypothetical protein